MIVMEGKIPPAIPKGTGSQTHCLALPLMAMRSVLDLLMFNMRPQREMALSKWGPRSCRPAWDSAMSKTSSANAR